VPDNPLTFSASNVTLAPEMTDTATPGLYIKSDTEVAIRSSAIRNIFVSLSPRQRVEWLYNNDKPKLVILITSIILSLYFIISGAVVVLKHITILSSLAAYAGDSPPQNILAGADLVSWGILGIIGVITIAAVRVWMVNGDENKSNQGFELVKMMFTAGLGFIVGKKT
jgi:hypothetical protein